MTTKVIVNFTEEEIQLLTAVDELIKEIGKNYSGFAKTQIDITRQLLMEISSNRIAQTAVEEKNLKEFIKKYLS